MVQQSLCGTVRKTGNRERRGKTISSSKGDAARFEDPKIAYTIKLIEAHDYISHLLNTGKAGKAAKQISTLLLRVHIPPKEKAMLKLRQILTPNNYNEFSSEEVVRFYTDLSEFLNRTYFADFHKAKPRYGTNTDSAGAEQE